MLNKFNESVGKALESRLYEAGRAEDCLEILRELVKTFSTIPELQHERLEVGVDTSLSRLTLKYLIIEKSEINPVVSTLDKFFETKAKSSTSVSCEAYTWGAGANMLARKVPDITEGRYYRYITVAAVFSPIEGARCQLKLLGTKKDEWEQEVYSFECKEE